jgi:hypothetical protein
MTMAMARKSATRNARKQPQQWLGGTQPIMQEDDHDHSHEERIQEHKKTRSWPRGTQLKVKEDNHNHGQEEAIRKTRG